MLWNLNRDLKLLIFGLEPESFDSVILFTWTRISNIKFCGFDTIVCICLWIYSFNITDLKFRDMFWIEYLNQKFQNMYIATIYLCGNYLRKKKIEAEV